MLTFALLAMLLVIVAGPAAAAEGTGLTLATAETEDEGADVSDEPMTDVVPAVEAEEGAEEEAEQPWTSRFLVPTVLAMGALGVVAAFGFYVVRVRGRYRVV
jgi:hypothetical protein